MRRISMLQASYRNQLFLGAFLIALLFLAGCGETPNKGNAKTKKKVSGDVTLHDAVNGNVAQVSVNGIDLQNVSVTITVAPSAGVNSITIPSGTVFGAQNAGTQNMM